jgi:hypothetical protein
VLLCQDLGNADGQLDPDQLLHAITQIPFIVYTILTLLSLIGLMILSESKYGERLIGIDIGVCALFGGYTVLSTKALSSLLSTIFLEVFKQPVGWILVGVIAGTSIMQVKYLNRALIRFESKVSSLYLLRLTWQEVIPTQFVFFSLSGELSRTYSGSTLMFSHHRVCSPVPRVSRCHFD